MTKFLHIVEQNLPDSEYGDQYDLIMVFKKAVNDLYLSNKIDFKIVPIQGTGSIEILSRDGKSAKLNHRAPARELVPSEEAEDPAMKNTPTTSSLAADLVKNDGRVKLALEPAIRKVSDALNKYARS